MPPIDVISLGAGVQSSCMSLMAAKGLITPMPRCGIFADTDAEPESVYDWLDLLERYLPFPILRVRAPGDGLAEECIKLRPKKGGGFWTKCRIPAFIKNPDGSKGIQQRQCTHDSKIKPVLDQQTELVGGLDMRAWKAVHKDALKELSVYYRELADWKRQRKADPQFNGSCPLRPHLAWAECQADPLINSWVGISWDEATRMKDPQKPWINNRYPLVDMRITRRDCLTWMKDNGFPQPPRSACVFCPYHSDIEWRRLKTEEPKAFDDAVKFEVALQAAQRFGNGQAGLPFLHASLKPLSEVDFSTEEDRGQLDMFSNECEGMCGV